MGKKSATPRTALVTGASSGIGAATARRLHEDGWKLFLWDVTEGPLKETAERTNASWSVVDVTDTEAVRSALNSIDSNLDAVVHSAGVLHIGLATDMPAEQHRRMIDINLWGTVNVVTAVLPKLKAAGGMLVMMGSTSAFYGPPEYASYGATKAGVLSFAQALRIELHDTEVDVAVCNPMFVAGPMLDNLPSSSRYMRSEGVHATADGIASLIVRAIYKRGPFNIVPGYQAWRIWFGSRYVAWAGNWLMGRAWRKAG
jgi:NADP-dependent 3-hydroxy acid dehydrogenase YdfG